MDEKQLLKLKEQIDEAKTAVSELRGHQTALLKQLKDDWGCKTVEEAQTKLKKMESEVSTLNDQITDGLKQLEEKYYE